MNTAAEAARAWACAAALMAGIAQGQALRESNQPAPLVRGHIWRVQGNTLVPSATIDATLQRFTGERRLAELEHADYR